MQSGHAARRPSTLSVADAAYLKQLMAYGWLLRAAIAVALHWTGYSKLLAPDEETYETAGRGLALFWSGELLVAPSRFLADEAQGYFYVNAAAHYLFGTASLPMKLLNAAIGVLVTRHVFLLALDLFGAAVARRAGFLCNYFPSLILWSAVNIRDIWVILLLVLVSRFSLAVVRGYSHLGMVKLLLSVYALSFFRDYLVFAVAFPPMVAILIGSRGHLLRNFALAGLAAIAVAVLLEHGIVRPNTQARMSLEGLSTIRQNMAIGGSAFQRDADISTPGRALAFLPIALAYFFFSPFPWQITSVLRLLSAPGDAPHLLSCRPDVPRIAFALRERLRDCLQILLMTALLTVTYALTEGNVGTLYRHRAQAMAFYLIFAAVGLELGRPNRGARWPPDAMIRVLALVPYPERRAPGQRFRIEQWAPLMRAEGVEVTLSPFLDDGGMDVLYAAGRTPAKIASVVRGYAPPARRVRGLRRFRRRLRLSRGGARPPDVDEARGRAAVARRLRLRRCDLPAGRQRGQRAARIPEGPGQGGEALPAGRAGHRRQRAPRRVRAAPRRDGSR